MASSSQIAAAAALILSPPSTTPYKATTALIGASFQQQHVPAPAADGRPPPHSSRGSTKQRAMAPVVLRMDVHCYGCADKIRRVLKNHFQFRIPSNTYGAHMLLDSGVEEVWVSVERGLVVVSGAALDASLMRRKIQKRTKRPVAIVSAGAEEPPPLQYSAPPPGYPPHLIGMAPHFGPHVPYTSYSYAQPPGSYPYGAPTVAGGGWVPPQHLLQHRAERDAVLHAQRAVALVKRRGPRRLLLRPVMAGCRQRRSATTYTSGLVVWLEQSVLFCHG
ncbi:hypothetical protein HU200_006901 [Digitaria exilis]|uniref:HMA domain-containing protein n=1 Tax=Digitaria exilis TaxID=1010633 RepID=A0A835FRP3_9POAL|nr:hypothetical protein HU200_006901 [Digitaria exilis]